MTKLKKLKKIVRKDTAETEEPKSISKDTQEKEYEYTPNSKPRAVEGFTTLSELAEVRAIQPQLARLWMKKADIKKPKDGWRWKDGSKELARVCKVLGINE